LQDFYETPQSWRDETLATKWTRIRAIRRVITGALEIERQNKTIGSSLEAAPTVYLEDSSGLDDTDWAEIAITSGITVSTDPAPADAFTIADTPGVAVTFAKASGAKCQRCWKILPDVGQHAHSDTCLRCNDALEALTTLRNFEL